MSRESSLCTCQLNSFGNELNLCETQFPLLWNETNFCCVCIATSWVLKVVRNSLFSNLVLTVWLSEAEGVVWLCNSCFPFSVTCVQGALLPRASFLPAWQMASGPQCLLCSGLLCSCSSHSLCSLQRSHLTFSTPELWARTCLLPSTVAWWQSLCHLLFVPGALVTHTQCYPTACLQMACFNSTCFSSSGCSCLFLLFALERLVWVFFDVFQLSWNSFAVIVVLRIRPKAASMLSIHFSAELPAQPDAEVIMDYLKHGKWEVRRDRESSKTIDSLILIFVFEACFPQSLLELLVSGLVPGWRHTRL